MRYSVFSVLDDDPSRRAPGAPDRYEEAIALARTADREGLDTFWVAEHHFHPGGVLPSPNVLLGALARETRRIRLGTMVNVLSLHRPRELAESLALVDRLSAGRLEIGLGSGYIPLEFQGYGIDPSQRRELFDAAYPELLSALSGELLAAPTAPGGHVRLNVLPVQRPYPPLWMAVQTSEALPFVAARGVSVAMIPYANMQGLPELSERVRRYREALPSGARTRTAAAFHIYVADRPSPGIRALKRYLEERLTTQSTHFVARQQRDPGGSTPESLVRNGLALIGTPGEIRERLVQIEACGITDVLGIFDFGGLTPGAVRASVRRFARLAGVDRPSPLSLGSPVEGVLSRSDGSAPPAGSPVVPSE